MLGGSESQVVAIDKARELGYFTVLCDYLPDNPGQYHADSFHLVSTTDKDAVLAVACEEQVDGIVAYGSDPAAPTAAYVAEKLGLPGVPYQTAKNFCEKHLFRTFLENNEFCVPLHVSLPVSDIHRAAESIAGMAFPLVVKPTDSSGSKGVSVVKKGSELNDALAYAAGYSRNGVLEIEEYITSCHPGVIEGELFVYGGKVVSWGLMNCLRDETINPLLPAGYCHPLAQSDDQIKHIKDEISRLINVSGIVAGALNIEMLLTADNKLYFLDAGPRNGGNMLPAFYSRISGDDLVEGTLRVAMGDPWSHHQFDGAQDGFWYMHVLHSRAEGVFDHVEYSETVRDVLRYEHVFVSPGDLVEPFKTSDKLLGLLMLCCESKSTLEEILTHINDHIRVVLKADL